MSTILDALRKLQGDRDRVSPPPRRDLRASVLDSPRLPVRAPRAQPKVRPLIAALGGGAFMAACIGGFLVWKEREVDPFERAAGSAVTREATQAAQNPTPPPALEPPRVPEPLVNLAAPPAPPPEAPEARYAAFQPSPPQVEPEPEFDSNSSSGPMLEAPETFPSGIGRARPAGAPRQAGESGDPGYGPPPNYSPPRIMTRAEAEAERARPSAREKAAIERARAAQSESRAPARRPLRDPVEEPAPPPAPAPRETAQAEVEPSTERPEAAAAALQFPVIEVQSVLWHPDPLRRQATILLEGQLTTDAREGDLIGGVFIDKITPGSVEFRMGQQIKRVDMAP